MRGLFAVVRDCVRTDQPIAVATVIAVADEGEGDGDERGGERTLGATLVIRPDADPLGSLGRPGLDRVVARDALGALDSGVSATRHYGPEGQMGQRDRAVFIEVFAPPRRMIIFGAVDFTAALVRVAKTLGYRVTVCDARSTFATPARFPEADEVVADWPHRYLAIVADQLTRRDAICVLTHDHKFDIPAIVAALATDVGYLGAMGSRQTHEGRVKRLREAGVDQDGLERIMAPIGIDIGARSPEETAVAVCAEIISLRAGVDAPSLRDGSGPIHRAPTIR